MNISFEQFLSEVFNYEPVHQKMNKDIDIFSTISLAYKDSKKFHPLDLGGEDKILKLIDSIGYNDLVNKREYRTTIIKIQLNNSLKLTKRFLIKKNFVFIGKKKIVSYTLVLPENPTKQFIFFQHLAEKNELIKYFDMDFSITKNDLKDEFKFINTKTNNLIDPKFKNFVLSGNLFLKEYDKQLTYISYNIINGNIINSKIKIQYSFGLKYTSKSLFQTLDVEFFLKENNIDFKILNCDEKGLLFDLYKYTIEVILKNRKNEYLKIFSL